jgi:protein SMG9
MSTGLSQLSGGVGGDRGSSSSAGPHHQHSHHPPPPPPPKILLAKPPLPHASSSGADDDGGTGVAGGRARQAPQPGSLSLVSDAWEAHTDKILPVRTCRSRAPLLAVPAAAGLDVRR